MRGLLTQGRAVCGLYEPTPSAANGPRRTQPAQERLELTSYARRTTPHGRSGAHLVPHPRGRRCARDHRTPSGRASGFSAAGTSTTPLRLCENRVILAQSSLSRPSTSIQWQCSAIVVGARSGPWRSHPGILPAAAAPGPAGRRDPGQPDRCDHRLVPRRSTAPGFGVPHARRDARSVAQRRCVIDNGVAQLSRVHCSGFVLGGR